MCGAWSCSAGPCGKAIRKGVKVCACILRAMGDTSRDDESEVGRSGGSSLAVRRRAWMVYMAVVRKQETSLSRKADGGVDAEGGARAGKA